MDLAGEVIVTTPGAPGVNVQAPGGSAVQVSPGVPGPPGAGVNLAGAVPAYGDLPGGLGVGDAGAAYLVQSNGKLYVWSGMAWPSEANGADFRGEQGIQGRGIAGISVDAYDLVFAMSESPSPVRVEVPALAAADAAADAAALSAGAAAGSALAAAGSESAAAGSASAASGSASTASGAASAATSAKNDAVSAKNAAELAQSEAEGARDEAEGFASSASSSASSASGSASTASGAALAASGSASAASSSASAASSSASAASTSESNASSSALAAGVSESNAAASALAASNSESAAADSEDAAALSASDAADSASSASSSKGAAASSASSAAGSALSASGSASAASGSASAANSSALNAAASESAASGSASAASSSESNAAASESHAADSADLAEYWANEAAGSVSTGLPSATTSIKGGVVLSSSPGEVGGTFDHLVVNGWADKADLVGGKIPASQIPAIGLTETYVVADEAARLALDCETGDVAVQAGNPGRGSYILQGTDPSDVDDWVMLVIAEDAVTSVNGHQGIIVLGKSDVGLGNVDNTSDVNKPVSSATQSALDAKVPNVRKVQAGTGLSGGGDLSADRTLAVAYGTSAGTATQGNDTRVVNAVQTSRMVSAGTGLSGGGALSSNVTLSADFGSAAGKVCEGNDSRLSNERTPSNGSVTTAKIADGNVTTDKIADSAVTSAKIADGTIVNADINTSAAIAKTKLASDVQTSLGKADTSIQASGAATGQWQGTAANLPGTGAAGVLYVVTG